MNEAFKKEVFEKLAKEVFKLHTERRFMKVNGFDDLSEMIFGQVLGIESAVEALGYDVNEFIEYYKANRSRYRLEMVA